MDLPNLTTKHPSIMYDYMIDYMYDNMDEIVDQPKDNLVSLGSLKIIKI